MTFLFKTNSNIFLSQFYHIPTNIIFFWVCTTQLFWSIVIHLTIIHNKYFSIHMDLISNL